MSLAKSYTKQPFLDRVLSYSQRNTGFSQDFDHATSPDTGAYVHRSFLPRLFNRFGVHSTGKTVIYDLGEDMIASITPDEIFGSI
jgi:hypothetical protein